MNLTLDYGTTSRLSLLGLQDEDGVAITGATVTATLIDARNRQIQGIDSPLTLADDGGGNYSGTVPAGVGVTPTTTIYALIVAVSGALQLTKKIRINVNYASE